MQRVLIVAVLLAVVAFYLAGQRENPPGFHFDEASVAYNALSIAQTGLDEHGDRLPIYFKAFGEYKNPVYIYLLSGLFKVVPPSTLAARRLSACLGIAAAFAFGLLGWRVTRSVKAVPTLVIAAVTPMFFDVSRLAFEAVVFPLAVVLFLLAARSAYESERWNIGTVVALATTLALVTYSYTAGRLLGPLFALLLLLFLKRSLVSRLLAVWALYALTLTPLAVFSLRNPDALLSRARYVAPEEAATGDLILAVARNYFLNLDPISFALVTNPNQIASSGGPVLLMMFPLAVAGIVMRRRDRWTWFLVAGALVSILPAAATRDVHHWLRLSAYVVFLIAACPPALMAAFDSSRTATRTFVRAMLFLGFIQAAWYFFLFYTRAHERNPVFDVGAREVVEAALARPERPIYAKGHQYIHAFWYGALNGVDRSAFRHIERDEKAPKGAVVIYEFLPPPGTIVISRHERFVAYIEP